MCQQNEKKARDPSIPVGVGIHVGVDNDGKNDVLTTGLVCSNGYAVLVVVHENLMMKKKQMMLFLFKPQKKQRYCWGLAR